MNRTAIVLRTPSGISGDMLLTGLVRLAAYDDAALADIIDQIGIDALRGCIHIDDTHVDWITGARAHIRLPHEHHHRTLADIRHIIEASRLPEPAKALSLKAFTILSQAEAKVHACSVEEVHFHEVGALDSILDTCVAATMFTHLAPTALYCSPLPISDGIIRCAHGLLASPPPAVQEMLEAVPVYGVDAQGETVTPTALAFLKAVGAIFGPWPACEVIKSQRVYGGKTFANLPNGAMFFLVQL